MTRCHHDEPEDQCEPCRLAADNAELLTALQRVYDQLTETDHLIGEATVAHWRIYDAQAQVQTAKAIAESAIKQATS